MMEDIKDGNGGGARTQAKATAATRQNTINRTWETVQAVLAVSLVMSMIFASLWGVVVKGDPATTAQVPESLKAATFIVLGFYFGRTNHTRPIPIIEEREGDR